MKHPYGNRKFRKRQKLIHLFWLAFWDSTGDAYKGLSREIQVTLCKSASIETLRKAEEKVKRSGL